MAVSQSGEGSERAGSAARVRLVALVVLLGVGAVFALVAVMAGGSDEPESARLRVELYPGVAGMEFVIYVSDKHNRPEVADNRSTVRVECVDASGAVLAKSLRGWPFTDTDNGTTEAHVHQPIAAEKIEKVARCRLVDTDPALQGPISEASIR